MPLDANTLMGIADICKRAVEDAVAPIRAENEALLEQVAALETELRDSKALVSQIQSQVSENVEAMKSFAHADAVAAVDDRIDEYGASYTEMAKTLGTVCKLVDGRAGAHGELEKRFGKVEDRLAAIDVTKTVETLWDEQFRNEVAAMLPDDWQPAIAALEKRVDGIKIPDALEPNPVQVIEAVKALYPSIRHDLWKHLPKIEHKGVYDPEYGEYGTGDEVIQNDSTYRAKRPTSEPPPHDDWQCIAKSKIGRRGVGVRDVAIEGKDLAFSLTDGKTATVALPTIKGDTGVGIEDLVLEDGVLVQKLTDGNTIVIDLTELLVKAIADIMKGDE